MREETANTGYRFFGYDQNPGFLGKDRAVFLVEAGGKRYKVIANLLVTHGLGTSIPDPCPPDQLKKLNGVGVTVNLADLTGSAVGQITGTTITLDDNAAGHDWYIDYTPYLNEEYLPTSNPNEWVAKEGSDAYGKMDMLSVLLHEYGHALGIEHSADPYDFMDTTLAPGARRLPSAEELALMARLVGEIRADMETPTPGDPIDRNQPGLPTGNGNFRTTRARLSRWGAFVVGEGEVEKTDPPQYAVAANPTLTDPRLETGAGWETAGNVSLGNGAAILRETADRQTRLNQVFIVGEHDRYLTFTLAGIGLDDVVNGPDDAFEAALLDANSGISLLAGTGLTRNDAFLNLQADGTERAGPGVSSTLNPDGSRTYRIDLGYLGGIPAGTAVNLSFDLIGFGPATSQVTVRDIRLGVPETRDDTATTAEDTPIDIAVTANDLDADQPGFALVIVAGPAHGSVTLNGTGGFTYTQEANFNGEDRIEYKVGDGETAVDTAIAFVVRPVEIVVCPRFPHSALHHCNDFLRRPAGADFRLPPFPSPFLAEGETL
jgi:hypothetical protein